MDPERIRQAQTRIECEYLEMPGLSLTGPQARKLFGLAPDLCDAALGELVSTDFLVETAQGLFQRRAGLTRHDRSYTVGPAR
jgi:hypothetical protein